MAVLALAVAAGCDSKKEAVMTSGIDLTNLDTTAVQGRSEEHTSNSSHIEESRMPSSA